MWGNTCRSFSVASSMTEEEWLLLSPPAIAEEEASPEEILAPS